MSRPEVCFRGLLLAQQRRPSGQPHGVAVMASDEGGVSFRAPCLYNEEYDEDLEEWQARADGSFERVYHPEVDLPALRAVSDNLGGLELMVDVDAEQWQSGGVHRGTSHIPHDLHASGGGSSTSIKRRQSDEGVLDADVASPPGKPSTPPQTVGSPMPFGQPTTGGIAGWPAFPIADTSGLPEVPNEAGGGPSKRIKTLWSTPHRLSRD